MNRITLVYCAETFLLGKMVQKTPCFQGNFERLGDKF